MAKIWACAEMSSLPRSLMSRVFLMKCGLDFLSVSLHAQFEKPGSRSPHIAVPSLHITMASLQILIVKGVHSMEALKLQRPSKVADL